MRLCLNICSGWVRPYKEAFKGVCFIDVVYLLFALVESWLGENANVGRKVLYRSIAGHKFYFFFSLGHKSYVILPKQSLVDLGGI